MSFCHPFVAGKKALFDVGIVEFRNFRYYDNARRDGQTCIVVGKRRPYKPLYSVSFNGFPVLFGEGDAHHRLLTRNIQYSEIRGKDLFPLSEQRVKLVILF